ncbi:hypothetical protein SAMN05518684_10755 [Salipaludibacillus aurantiacus]|uniref:Uncharacterized protein n=1 Tax=Salipaludibacillus aurantiacus TaxID=1601833 RepID=A0A1H9UA52_9BACI|nr:hypothetical protein SAMN05518684_10755 [Salipaludibacillus aurantiacus]
MNREGNFFVGLIYGIGFSIPLWMSFFGWIKLISRLVS